MATSGRRPWKPFGYAGLRDYVRNANVITTRLVLIWILATCRYVFTASEQPGSSLMPVFPYVIFFQKLISIVYKWFHVRFPMAVYGAPTLKPSQVPALPSMVKKPSKRLRAKLAKRKASAKTPMVKHTINKLTGKRQVTGAAGLKLSQVYPPKYGRVLAKKHAALRASEEKATLRLKIHGNDLIQKGHVHQAPYGWRHASLGDLEKFLISEAKAGRFTPQFEGGLDL
eukprot:s333_g8.t1